uniref:Cytochrome c oxidase subunit 2 n=1 Tax=Watersipora subtorquata TaxID=193294 RepID=C4MEF7_9BILA|nr:cytochrome c oxidase subunit II [Watersipora subtorquata]ABY55225.1 cytochrome c oxidase subunit II [Watersipora subtorquata]
MAKWAQLMLNESNTMTMQFLSLFHDLTLVVIILILFFVSGISLFMMTNKLISDSPIVTMMEVIWTVIPMLILLILGNPIFKYLMLMEESDPYMTFKAMGHQWYWSYEIADTEISFNSYMVPNPWLGEYRLLESDHRMILPYNKNIQTLISATDVLHCWTLPSVGVKADAVPGRLNQVFFQIMRPGVMYGQCSEICGSNHTYMPITVEAIKPEFFYNWIKEMKLEM